MLDFPRPRLHAYPPETVIAEKLHAMVKLGRVNSRMRDFHDVFVLQAERDFRGSTLVRVVRATFRRRETALPAVRPVALTAEFAKEASPRWIISSGRSSRLSKVRVGSRAGGSGVVGGPG